MRNRYFLLILFFFGICLAACSDKTIELNSPALFEYFPLVPGKYVTYRLDSTVPTQFGRDTTVRSYRVRDLVDAEIKDGQNRISFRIIRTMSNVSGTDPFLPSNTFQATPDNTDWIEYVENNLRFMKLRFPIRDGFEWPGNSFIEVNGINSDVRYLANWNYQYQNVGAPFTINGKTYPNTITVLQRDEVIPEGPFNPNFFKQYNFSIEVYALGVGLVYKNFQYMVWQPPTPPPGGRPGYWEDGSYRIILSALDHN
jgi:hypothetical protein